MPDLLKRIHRNSKGFTLVELLIVVAILGVLAAVVLPNVTGLSGEGETEGYDTVVVTDEGTTLAMLDRMEPDLVILNSGSEGNENFQELERIRRHSDVPVIILAADYEMKALRRAFSLGADDYIRKPFPMRPFLARVRAKLRRAREYSYHSSLITT